MAESLAHIKWMCKYYIALIAIEHLIRLVFGVINILMAQ